MGKRTETAKRAAFCRRSPGRHSAVLKITDALMDEGPVRGISNMDEPEEFLKKVIKKAEAGYPVNEEEKRILEAAGEWSEE